MSRILRRPMFRGGGAVDSYGKGITAPLVPGYMGGGQIGGGIVYGKPMADGRFGFEKPIIPNFTMPNNILTNVEKALGGGSGITTGAELLRAANQKLRTDDAYGIPAGVAMKDDKESDTKLIADQKDFIQKFTENDQIGRAETSDGLDYLDFTNKELGVDENTILPGEEIIEIDGVKVQKKNTKLVPVNKDDSFGPVKRVIDTSKVPSAVQEANKNMKSFPADAEEMGAASTLTIAEGEDGDGELEEKVELSAKDAIAENQKLFAELLGADKARGQDIGDMLLRFSGSGGNTLGEKFQNYVKAESAAGPSRSEKIKQTAAGLAINDYVAGKRSKEQIEALKTKIDYTQDKKDASVQLSVDDPLPLAKAKSAKLADSSVNSDATIANLIQTKVFSQTGSTPNVHRPPIKLKNIDKSKSQEKLKVGYNLVDNDGITTIVSWDGNNYNILGTIDTFWSS